MLLINTMPELDGKLASLSYEFPNVSQSLQDYSAAFSSAGYTPPPHYICPMIASI